MNELIKVNYYNEQPTVSGRELHGFLQVGTAYKDWFPRMCEYGFEEGKDFCSCICFGFVLGTAFTAVCLLADKKKAPARSCTSDKRNPKG